MFSLKHFIKKGLLDEADLAEISAKIDALHPAVEDAPVEEAVTE